MIVICFPGDAISRRNDSYAAAHDDQDVEKTFKSKGKKKNRRKSNDESESNEYKPSDSEKEEENDEEDEIQNSSQVFFFEK